MFPRKQILNEILKVPHFDIYIDNDLFIVVNKSIVNLEAPINGANQIVDFLQKTCEENDACFITYNDKKVLL